MAADLKGLVAAERRDLADFLDSLRPEDWASPSLCAGWSVRDVVAHLVSYEELGVAGVAVAFVRGRFSPSRINAQRLAAYRDRSPVQLVELLRSHLQPAGFTALGGGGIGLSDCLIHHQDIRRGLGRPRTVPTDRLQPVLGVVLKAPVLPAKRLAKGLRFTATDLDWSTGTGPEVSGPAEALLMSLAGRRVAVADLTGPGVAELRSRLDITGS